MSAVSASDWVMGVTFSVIASIIGGASKLAIRKSWLIDAERKRLKAAALASVFDHTEIIADDNNTSSRINNHGDGVASHDAPVSEIAVRSSSTQRGVSSNDNFNDNAAAVGVGSNDEEKDNEPRKIATDNLDKPSPVGSAYLAPLEVTSPCSQGVSTTLPTPASLGQGSYFSMDEERQAELQEHNNTGNLSPAQQYSLAVKKLKISIWSLYAGGMFGMTVLNPLFCVLAMKYANPSILAPFSGLTLVWVILFSGVVVGEHPELSQKVACGSIMVGEVMVALFGDHTNEEWDSYDDVIASYKQPGFVAYLIFMFAWIIFLSWVIKKHPKPSHLRKLAWGSLGGSITGLQCFLKDWLTIASIAKENNTEIPSTIFILMFLAMATSLAGLMCLSACMKRFDATYSSAMFVVSFVISASLMSAIHYQTFDHLDNDDDKVLYPMGLIVLFWGATTLIKPSSLCFAGEPDILEEESIIEPDDLPQERGGNEEWLLS